eukprot:39649-Eustigmatos_ZCMA.PRE.1
MNNLLPAADRMPENELMSLALRNLARGYRMLLMPHAPYANFDALLRETLQMEKDIGIAHPQRPRSRRCRRQQHRAAPWAAAVLHLQTCS